MVSYKHLCVCFVVFCFLGCKKTQNERNIVVCNKYERANFDHNMGYDTFDTFDEYRMEGVKTCTSNDSKVYVKRKKNEIRIKTSVTKDSTLVYKKIGEWWHTKAYYNIYTESVDKNGDNIPQRYDRFFVKDTIVEYLTQWIPPRNDSIHYIFIRTHNALVAICGDVKTLSYRHSPREIIDHYKSLPDLRKNKFSYLGSKPGYYTFRKKYTGDSVLYECDFEDGSVKIKTVLGKFGEFMKKTELKNSEMIFIKKTNILPPQFPGGKEKLYREIQKSLDEPYDFTGITKLTIILKLRISPTGLVEEAISVKEPVPTKYVKRAKKVAMNLPPFSPATSNGKPVEGIVYATFSFRVR